MNDLVITLMFVCGISMVCLFYLKHIFSEIKRLDKKIVNYYDANVQNISNIKYGLLEQISPLENKIELLEKYLQVKREKKISDEYVKVSK